METISYQIIILAFVVLIALIVAAVMVAAFKYGKQYRQLHDQIETDQQLIELMEEEREQKNKIIHLIKTKPTTHLN